MSQKAKKMNNYLLVVIAIFYLSINSLSAQKVKGTVVDIEDNTIIPFVNIFFKGSTRGGISDYDGKFKIKWDKNKKDSLVFSFIGYNTKTIALKDYKNGAIVYMKKEAEQLNEVIISAKMLPYTEYLMRKIIKNKKYNNPEKIKKVQFTETSLLLVYLANIKKKVMEKKRFKKDKDAFIADTDSTVMMPLLLTKQVIKHRIDKGKNINNKEILKVEQKGTFDRLNNLIKTVINKKIAQNINFYDENIHLLGRSFQSPITSNYKSFYKLYLSDSIMVNGVKQYEFQYYPKNKKSIAFDGSFWIDSKTFALTKIKASLPIDANVNFIEKLEFEITYKKDVNNKWYVVSQNTNTAFSFMTSKRKKKRNFSVQKKQKYSAFQLGNSTNTFSVNSNKKIDSTNSASTHIKYNDTSLDISEEKTIKGINQLKNNSYLKFIDRFGTMTLTGYYNLNKFDLGPYFDFYVKNGIEGSRFTLPIRTSEKMSKNFTVGGYLGYGTKDKKFKYGFETKYLLSSKKRTILSLNHYDDFKNIAQNRYLEFVQENPYSKGGGNILSVFATNKNLNFSMLRQKHFSIGLSYEATENVRYLFRPFYDTFYSNTYNKLINNTINVNGFRTTGLLMDLRYSKARSFDQQFFAKIYYGTTKPVYHITAEIGNNKIVDNSSNYSANYLRLNASVKKKYLIGSTFVKMFFQGGYIFGKVPFPILNNPSGNQNIGLARFNYNLLNPISFSSDAFADLHLSFNGGGFLFNKMPLLSSLNIRESMSFKAFYGKLRDEHSQFFQLPTGLVELGKEPYVEVGIGVSNIFKVLRIEYIRRINSASFFDNISAKDGIKLRIEVSF